MLARSYRLTPWHADTFQLMHEDWENPGYPRFSRTAGGVIDGVEAFAMLFERVEDDPDPGSRD